MLARLKHWLRTKGEDPLSGTAKPLLWLSNLFGGAATSAGTRVSAANAMRCAAVYACVRVVAEDVAKLPLIVYRRKANGGREPATNHPLYKLLSRKPNGWQSAFEWLEMSQAHLELRGNAYSYIERDQGGRVLRLIPLPPDRVVPMRSLDGEPFYHWAPVSGEPWAPHVIPGSAMLHLRAMTLDGWIGLSTIDWIRETIGLSIAAESHAAAYFGNGARPDIVISSKEATLTPEQATAIRDAWEKNYRGVTGAYRPAVLPHNLSVEKLSLTNKDSQFIELRQFQVSDVARGFRIPPHKIGDLSRSTNNNIEHQGLEYYLDGLMPRLERFEAALSRDLLTDAEAEQYEIEFDFTRILRGDLKSTMEAIGAGRNWGVVNANEARSWLNLPPREGGDQFLEPVNTMPAGADRSAAAGGAGADKPPSTPAQEQERQKLADNVLFLRRSVERNRRSAA